MEQIVPRGTIAAKVQGESWSGHSWMQVIENKTKLENFREIAAKIWHMPWPMPDFRSSMWSRICGIKTKPAEGLPGTADVNLAAIDRTGF